MNARHVRHVACWLFNLLVLCAMSPAVWAKGPKPSATEESASKDYVMSWVIVGALVGLGLMTLCRPGKREEKVEVNRADDE